MIRRIAPLLLFFSVGFCQTEKDRKSSVHTFIEKEKSQAGYCIDGGAAVHFINEVYDKTLSFYLHKNAFYVEKKNGKIIESVLASTRIS